MGLSIIEFFNFTIGLIISNDLRRGRYVVYNLHVHLVFVTKYRRAVFTKQVLDGLEAIKHPYP
ncbi:transposase [Moraxella catarrhalis]|uniref:transposase n=1 Tax=Moraxella catarrhalis TaxID=480 RepID=UPI001F528A74|nr:transposase [Moraxella catarrhalis]